MLKGNSIEVSISSSFEWSILSYLFVVRSSQIMQLYHVSALIGTLSFTELSYSVYKERSFIFVTTTYALQQEKPHIFSNPNIR